MAWEIGWKAMGHACVLALLALAAPAISLAASDRIVSTEASFGVGGRGAVPLNGNLLYSNQYIYGATSAGGIVIATDAMPDDGVVFRRPAVLDTPTAAYTLEILYIFSGADGAHPNNSLIADAHGNIYGTTRSGGAQNLGTVFKLTKPPLPSTPWALTTLHSFTGSDGAYPAAGVTLGPDGALYGTAQYGGITRSLCIPPQGCGTVFKIAADGTFSILHVFTGAIDDGAGPASNLVLDPTGIVIGLLTNEFGNELSGGLFAIRPDNSYVLVASFPPNTGPPAGNIVRDGQGNVFGTLFSFQASDQASAGAAIFEVTAVTHKIHIVAQIVGETSLSGVVRDAAGNFYGTTTGLDPSSHLHVGNGSVFVASPAGTVTILAPLPPANEAPSGGVVGDPAGNLWGTSTAGGALCPSIPNLSGCGTVFVVTPPP